MYHLKFYVGDFTKNCEAVHVFQDVLLVFVERFPTFRRVRQSRTAYPTTQRNNTEYITRILSDAVVRTPDLSVDTSCAHLQRARRAAYHSKRCTEERLDFLLCTSKRCCFTVVMQSFINLCRPNGQPTATLNGAVHGRQCSVLSRYRLEHLKTKITPAISSCLWI